MKKQPKNKLPYRILYVENGIGYGGAIICLRHLVRNLDRTRFEPMIVTGRSGPQYREIASECQWKHFADRRVDLSSIRTLIERAPWIERIPGMCFLLNQLSARLDDVANFLPFFLRLLLTARQFRPALIHANNEPLCNRAAILAGKILGVPVICHVRGDPTGSSRMTRWLYRFPIHFIPVSRWVSEGIGRLGVPEEKRTIVHDGIALENLDLNPDGRAFRQAYGIPENAFVVGLVGLLIPWKGQRLFVDVARALREEIPDLYMLIIGGTPDDCIDFELELKERVRDEGLSRIVVFTGHIDDMPSVYNALDVVVSASTSPEPLGTMVIECMAMGRPLVAPAHGGAVEMAENNKTALLFTPGDAVSLRECIRRLYDTPGLSSRLGKSARRKALDTFAVAAHVSRVQSVYEQCQKEGFRQ